jgi:hypothetical protein
MLDDHRKAVAAVGYLILAIAPTYPSAALLGYPVILTKPVALFRVREAHRSSLCTG